MNSFELTHHVLCIVTNEEMLTLLEENRRLREVKSCKVCLDDTVNTVFLPCGHLICCTACAECLLMQPCPICDQCVERTITVTNFA